jgi:2-polyprenyl-3-methyl-5-hydroxy-6-metoxy-1,4-benzoquinol methylase
MDRICPPPIEYDKEYFFESYKRQYGKTYIEDFPNLKVMAKCRLKKIKSLLSDEKERTVLDIGCAYGAFLAAAKEEGFEPFGIDPAEDAVNYVRQTLGINAIQGFFPDCQLPGPYSVITLWYVIEHFTDCRAVFEKIKKILKPGGILAFSTPSFSGISGTSSLKNFLEKSPGDHYTIWSPKMCKKTLALCGFKVKKIVVSGHHPERFPILGKFAKSKKGVMYRLLMAISKIFGLGDTFEVYAESC